jgi:hypothetical protein
MNTNRDIDARIANALAKDKELDRCRAALRDIATSEPIPTPGEAYEWCKRVATDALNPK